MKLRTKDLIVMGLLIALKIILGKVLQIQVIPGVLVISFGFLPIALVGMLYGTLPCVFMAAAADLLGAFIYPTGPFFPGYTLTAAVTGLLYGSFLHGAVWENKKQAILKVALCEFLVALICYVGLNTLWTTYFTGKGYLYYLPTRAIKNIVQYPVDVFILLLLIRYRKTLERAVK